MNNSSVVSAGASPVQEITVVNFLGEDIRVLGTPQDPLFIAADVAKWIDHDNPTMMCRMLDVDDLQKVSIISSYGTNGATQTKEVLTVTEQGLYKILWRSNKPKAQQFASKCADIIKEIRLTGSYSVTRPSYQIEDPIARAQKWIDEEKERIALLDQNNDQKHIIKQQNNMIDILLPKARAFEDEISTDGWYSGSAAAKIIYGETFKGGRNKLYEFLREKGILLRVGKHNMPSGYYMDNGWLKAVWHYDDREKKEIPTPVFSMKGIRGIHKMIIEGACLMEDLFF